MESYGQLLITVHSRGRLYATPIIVRCNVSVCVSIQCVTIDVKQCVYVCIVTDGQLLHWWWFTCTKNDRPGTMPALQYCPARYYNV